MKILSIGCGYIGSVLAEEICQSLDFEQLIMCDSETKKIEETARKYGEKIFPVKIDLSNSTQLLTIIDDVDLVIGLSPGRLGYSVMKVCVEKKKNLVDLSYMPENPFVFHDDALEAGIIIIPDCGVAPGLSNILLGQASTHLDKIDDAIIYVGGLPQNPVAPLDYKVTWCVEDLFEEYTRKAKIVRGGKLIEVNALEGLEKVDFGELGRFEAFFTDGVRTLHHTINADNLWEKTIRYEGHAEKVTLLKQIGLFSKDRIKGTQSPWEFMVKFWEEKLSFVEEKDFVIMRILLRGRKNSQKTLHAFELIDYFDEQKNITAMGRTTAYTAYAVIKLLMDEKIDKKGVIPPEILGMDTFLFGEIMKTLHNKNLTIQERVKEL